MKLRFSLVLLALAPALCAQSNLIQSTGPIGIGTTTPIGTTNASIPLEVVGQIFANVPGGGSLALNGSNANSQPVIYFERSGGAVWLAGLTGDASASFFINNGYGGGNVMTMSPGGYVGIGTTTPNAKLDVVGGSIRSNGGIISTASGVAGLFGGYGGGLDGSTFQQFALYADTTNGLYFDAPKDGSGNKLDVQFNWRGGGIPGLVIKGSTGNVGIGTTGPASLAGVSKFLDISGATTSIVLHSTSASKTWEMFNDGPGLLRFYSGGHGDTMALDQSGNVGIGTTSPATRLEVNGDLALKTSGRAYFYINGGNGDSEAMWAENGANRWALGMNVGEASQNFNLYNYTTGAINFSVNKTTGNVGIGTTNPSAYKLAVNGQIHAKEVVVDITGWSDYVFDESYQLKALSEVEAYVKTEHHLPGVPSAAQVAKDGITVGEMQSRLLAKIEELTLHQIEQEKTLSEQQKQLEIQRAEIFALKNQLNPPSIDP